VTTTTQYRRTVEFYATSPRLAHAYRSAAKRNKGLARWAETRELLHTPKHRRAAEHAHGFEMVVLSHADDDHLVLTDARWEAVVAEAFHLLFTEPTTHPGQVARWMRTTNIRSEKRLHVVKVDDLEAPEVSQLLGRVCLALGRDGSGDSIIDAYLAGNSLLVRGPRHRMLHVPVSSVPALRGQPRTVLGKFEIDPDGSFIRWPDLDVHLGWNQFLQAVDPAELRKAQQRSAGFNERYGAAIRKVRETAGILQSKVEGLTERQLRRIEQGECRATTPALTALARAHGLDVNAYMDRLANAMQ
jgi:Helix-turn-helix domain